MIKRIIILAALVSILVVLLRVQPPSTSKPTSSNSKDSTTYSTVEYEITDIKGDEYYGKSENGHEIIFSAKTIRSGDEIQVHDFVICYFEKNNLGKGLVKVEKK